MKRLVFAVMLALTKGTAVAQVITFPAEPPATTSGSLVRMALFAAEPHACDASAVGWLAMTTRAELCACVQGEWRTVGTLNQVCRWK